MEATMFRFVLTALALALLSTACESGAGDAGDDSDASSRTDAVRLACDDDDPCACVTVAVLEDELADGTPGHCSNEDMRPCVGAEPYATCELVQNNWGTQLENDDQRLCEVAIDAGANTLLWIEQRDISGALFADMNLLLCL